MSDKKIEGIYNYCDRWCERCSFTMRCGVYSEEGNITDKERYMHNKAFWDRLSVNFSKAMTVLEEATVHHGKKFNDVKDAGVYEEKKRNIQSNCESHPLSKMSLEYSELSRTWLKTQPGMMDKLEFLKEQLTLGVESVKDAKIKTEMIKDCLETIQWYQTFIYVKLMRALMGRFEYTEYERNEEAENVYQSDSEGSAKIAMIAIDRSMQAWIKLYDLLPDKEDDFLKILGLLEKIKNETVKEFPNADQFKRPGFDEQY